MNLRRANLNKCYKKVITCKICKQLFGSDLKVKRTCCPVCMGELRKPWMDRIRREEASK